MSFTLPVSGGALGAALLWVGKKLYDTGHERVKKWDKHCIDDDQLHAILQQKLTEQSDRFEEQSNRLKSVDEKIDRLVYKMIPDA